MELTQNQLETILRTEMTHSVVRALNFSSFSLSFLFFERKKETKIRNYALAFSEFLNQPVQFRLAFPDHLTSPYIPIRNPNLKSEPKSHFSPDSLRILSPPPHS